MAKAYTYCSPMFGFQPVTRPWRSNAAALVRWTPLIIVKAPPTYRVEVAASYVRARTAPLGFGAQLVSLPLLLLIAARPGLRLLPTLEKSPPMYTVSLDTARAYVGGMSTEGGFQFVVWPVERL